MEHSIRQPSRSRIALTLGLGQALGRGSLALVMLLLVRALPAADYGQLALTVALVAILVAIADGGFSRLIVRDLARGVIEGGDIWRVLGVRAGSVLAVSMLVAIVGLTSGRATLAYVGLSCAFLIGEALSFGFESAAVGVERPWRFVMAQATGALALLGGIATLTVLDAATLEAVLATLAGASFVRTLAHAVIWGVRRRALTAWRGGRPAAELLRAALPFLALSVMSTMQYRLGVVVCYAIEGSAETAPYAAAVRVLDVAGVLGAIAFSAVAPVFSRAHQAGDEEVWRLWSRYIRRMALIALPVGAGLAIAGQPIAGLLFGARYEESAGTDLSLLAPAAALIVLLSVSSVVLYMDDRSGGLLRLTALNLVVNLALTIPLTVLGGHHGTAAAVSIGELVSFCGFAFVIVRRHRLGTGSQAPARS